MYILQFPCDFPLHRIESIRKRSGLRVLCCEGIYFTWFVCLFSLCLCHLSRTVRSQYVGQEATCWSLLVRKCRIRFLFLCSTSRTPVSAYTVRQQLRCKVIHSIRAIKRAYGRRGYCVVSIWFPHVLFSPRPVSPVCCVCTLVHAVASGTPSVGLLGVVSR